MIYKHLFSILRKYDEMILSANDLEEAMTNRHRINDPIAEVLAKKEDLGLVQSVTYTSNGALAIKGEAGTLLLPAGSCKPSTAADITDLLDMGEHTRTLPLFRVGDQVEIERQGRIRRFNVTGTL